MTRIVFAYVANMLIYLVFETDIFIISLASKPADGFPIKQTSINGRAQSIVLHFRKCVFMNSPRISYEILR